MKLINVLIAFSVIHLLALGFILEPAVLAAPTLDDSAVNKQSGQHRTVKEFLASTVFDRKVNDVFSKVRAEGPGAIVTIADNGNIVFQKSYGLADTKEKSPILPTTLFELASCSKQFTAAAILILCDRGKISLDDDICKYYPELAQKKTKGRVLLVRDLLAMTSGLLDYSEMSSDEVSGKRPEDVLLWTAVHSRKFNPGEKFAYNNGNYVLSALLVERVTKEKFADFVKREIFQPAGMMNTFVMTEPGMNIPNRAGGYKKARIGFDWSRDDTYIVGDGQIMTTSNDFVAWDKYLRAGKLLNPETQKLAFTSGALNNGKKTGYGFGWGTGRSKGHPYVDHSGRWAGTSTYILHFLDSGISLIVLSNNEDFGAGEIGAKLAAQILNDFQDSRTN